MSGDTIIAMTGLMGLAAAGLAGALWDGPLVTALFRVSGYFRRNVGTRCVLSPVTSAIAGRMKVFVASRRRGRAAGD
jgi:hypothetical protein